MDVINGVICDWKGTLDLKQVGERAAGIMEEVAAERGKKKKRWKVKSLNRGASRGAIRSEGQRDQRGKQIRGAINGGPKPAEGRRALPSRQVL